MHGTHSSAVQKAFPAAIEVKMWHRGNINEDMWSAAFVTFNTNMEAAQAMFHAQDTKWSWSTKPLKVKWANPQDDEKDKKKKEAKGRGRGDKAGKEDNEDKEDKEDKKDKDRD